MTKEEQAIGDPRFARLTAEQQSRVLTRARELDTARGTPPTPAPTIPVRGETRSPGKPPVPPALRTAEDIIGGTAGMIGGEALAAPAILGAGAIPIVGPAAALGVAGAASGAGNVAAQYGMEGLNRALGYAPTEISPGREFALGAAARPTQALMGAGWRRIGKPAARWVSGITGAEKARKAAVDLIRPRLVSTFTALHEAVDDSLYKLHDLYSQATGRSEAALREAAKQQRGEVLEGLLGGSARETAARMGQSAMSVGEGVLERRQTRGVFRGLYRRMQDQFGRAYQQLYEPHYGTELPKDAARQFGEEVKGILANAENFESLPAELRSRLQDIARYADADPLDEIRAEITAKFGKAMADPTQLEGAVQAMAAERGVKALPALRVGDLLSLKGDMRRFADHPRGPARTVERFVTGNIHRALGKLGVPQSAELNEAYNLWRDRFTPGVLRQLNHGEVVTDFPKLFQTKVFGSLLSQATPDEKGLLRKMVGDYARRVPSMTPAKFAQMFPPDMLAELYGGTKPWAEATHDILRFGAETESVARILDTMPTLREPYMQVFERQYNETMRRAALATKKRVMQALKQAGPAANDLRMRFAHAQPEKVAEFYFNEMRRPEFMQGLMGMTEKAVELPPQKGFQRAMRRAVYPVVIGGSLAATGHMPGPWVLHAAAAGTLGMAGWGMRQLFVNSFENPRGLVRTVHSLLQRPVSQTTMRVMGRWAGQAYALEVLRSMGGSGGSKEQAQPQPAPAQPGQILPVAGQGPTAGRPTVADPVMGEVQRLGIAPPVVGQVRFDNVQHALAPEVNQKFLAARDQLIRTRMGPLLQSHVYRQAPQAAQHRIVQKIVGKAHREAFQTIRPELLQMFKDDVMKRRQVTRREPRVQPPPLP